MRTRRWFHALITTACLLAIATGPAAALTSVDSSATAASTSSRSVDLDLEDTLLVLALGGGRDRDDDDDFRDRRIRVSEGDDTRCVSERRVWTSAYSVRTVCVSPAPELDDRDLRERRVGDDGDGLDRRDLGFTLRDNLDRDLGFRFIR